MSELKVYEKIGLTKDDVVQIQEWLFPMVNETNSVADMIVKTVEHFNDTKLYYALYILGNEIGQASIKERFGMLHTLNPQNV